MSKSHCALTCVTIALMPFMAPATASTEYDHVLPAAQQKVRCMMQELKKAPGYRDPQFGTEKGQDGAIRPYVQYRFTEAGSDHAFLVHFSEGTQVPLPYDSNDKTYVFSAYLPGLSDTKHKAPPDYGSQKIAERWKAHCGVVVTTFLLP